MRHLGGHGLEPREIDRSVHPPAPGEVSWAQAPVPVASGAAAFHQAASWLSICPMAVASSRNETGLASVAKDHQPGAAYQLETLAVA